MRIYLGGIATESNTFSPVKADLDLFRRGYCYEGDEILRLKKTSMEACGFYERLESVPEVEIVNGFMAFALTAGKVTKAAFKYLGDKLFDSIAKAGKLDGVLLALHGAMVSEDCDDCEGFLLERVRAIVGPDAKIVCSLDMHCCMTKKMVENSDGFFSYLTYPHRDHKQTGYRAAECLVGLLQSEGKVEKIYRRIPFIMPVENCSTDQGPIVPAMEKVKALLCDSNISSAALYMTQPWLDVFDLGCSMTVYVKEGADSAVYEKKTDEILAYLWDNRAKFFVDVPQIEKVLENIDDYEKPLSIVELGDIVSAGGIGDSTYILRALIKMAPNCSTVVTLVDAGTVRQAWRLGTGKAADFMIGGSTDYGYNAPTPVHATVLKMTEEMFAPKGESQKGLSMDAGKRALLKYGDYLYIIVSEYACFNHDPELLVMMGLAPRKTEVVVQKTHQLFKAGYKNILKSYVYVDTPGFTDRNISRLPFKNVERPIFPLDDMGFTPNDAR